MTSYPIGLFLVASLACGQDGGAVRPQPSPPPSTQPPTAKAPAETGLVHRLEAVTWNPAAGELSWVVTVWNLNGGAEQQVAKQDYTVRLENATMKSKGEVRTFDTEEAKQVRMVMDLISAYAVVSTVWWERGQGGKPEECPEDEKGKDKKSTPSTRPTTVGLTGPIAASRPLPQAAGPAAGWH